MWPHLNSSNKNGILLCTQKELWKYLSNINDCHTSDSGLSDLGSVMVSLTEI